MAECEPSIKTQPVAINLNYRFNKETEQSGVKKERRNIFPSLCSGQLQISSNKIL
uniref:Uncharacterized protein n=1 Tax=Rhizophagus irregularis (strain DAOM 181602 / DAOM 197198 / MUCL 43194) TaxID=747089 RepID=U9T9F1_RHIID